MIPHKCLPNLLYQSGFTLLATLVVYGLNYIAAPFFVGMDRLQAALRPRVYAPTGATGWEAGVEGTLEQYAQANALIDHGYFSLGMDRTLILSMVGNTGRITEEGGREVWQCDLVPQGAAPARSWLFPGRFDNRGIWVFRIEFEGERITRYAITSRPRRE